jgi:3-oxoadipate enol-lactonase/4-carboxymuconolactone decarboxylase
MSHSNAPEVAADQAADCPTPLAWQQVLEAFRHERRLCRVESNGGPLCAWTLGEGPPLYFLNGFVDDESLWALLVWLLREEHMCVICDRPSMERTSARDAHQQLAGLARSVLTIADAQGHDRIALHATSFGCLVALQMLLDEPHRVTRASLQRGFAARRFSWTERSLLSLGCRAQGTMSRLRPAVAIQRLNHRHWFPPFDPTRWDFYEQQLGLTPIRSVADAAWIAGQVDLRTRLQETTTPVLIIQTEGDGQVSTDAQQELVSLLPRAYVQSLDNCGSLPHLTHPHRLANMLRTFRDKL